MNIDIKERNYIPQTILPDIFEEAPKSGVIRENFPVYTAAIIGHVDNGKSTLLGRLLHACGRVKQHTIDEYEKEAKLLQKNTFQYAWVLDSTALERAKGVTIDLAFVEFNTASRYFTMVDCPGHKDYLKNAITGLSQADLAILALDAKKGLDLNVNAKEHLTCAKASGVNSLVVALTKIDTVPLADRQAVIEERKKEVLKFVTENGFNPRRVKIVPVNAYEGWNLIDNKAIPTELPFYDGQTLIEAIDTIEMDPIPFDKPMRMAVEGIHTKVSGTNCVVTGKVLSGEIKPKDKVLINPGNHIATVRKIHMHHQTLKKAIPNTNVGLDLTGIDPKVLKRGAVIAESTHVAKAVKQFTCETAVIKEHPTQISVGARVIGHYLTGNVSLKIESISNVYDLKVYRGDFKEAAPDRTHVAEGYTHGQVKSVKAKHACKIVFTPQKPIVLEPAKENPKIANIILRDFGTTIGWGKVTEVVPVF